MSTAVDQELLWLVVGVLFVLIVGSVAGAILARRATGASARATVANLNDRIRAWWVMAAVLAIAAQPLRSAECSQPQPRSRSRPRISCVYARPPRRELDSSNRLE